MIIGIGTDLCDIRRINKSLDDKGQKFLDRIFTKGEQDYCRAHAKPEERFAKRFAAKEAVAKALSTEDSGWLSWTDVEVVNQDSGRPDVVLHGEAKTRLEKLTPSGHIAMVRVTLSDEPPYALAFVVIEAVKTGAIL